MVQMIRIYCYNELNHQHFSLKTLYKMLKLKSSILENIILTLQTLIGGYFSNQRLEFQLSHLFSERQGWYFPLGEAIAACIYKAICHNYIFLYGMRPIREYQRLKCLRLVGIFYEPKPKPTKKKPSRLFRFLCFCFCLDVKE